MTACDFSETRGRAGDYGRSCDDDLTYRLRLKDAMGFFLRDEDVRAHSDEDAINLAVRRLERAAIVEVWRYARWVCQVQRAAPTVH